MSCLSHAPSEYELSTGVTSHATHTLTFVRMMRMVRVDPAAILHTARCATPRHNARFALMQRESNPTVLRRRSAGLIRACAGYGRRPTTFHRLKRATAAFWPVVRSTASLSWGRAATCYMRGVSMHPLPMVRRAPCTVRHEGGKRRRRSLAVAMYARRRDALVRHTPCSLPSAARYQHTL